MTRRTALIASALSLLIPAFGLATPAEAATAGPTITGMSSYFSLAGGGQTLTIKGTSLKGITTVLFGTTPGTNVKVVSSSQVTVKVPAHALGTVTVQVKTSRTASTANDASQFTFHTQAPAGAKVTVSKWLPDLTFCQVGNTCNWIQATTSSFTAETITCRITSTANGPVGGVWTQGPAATYQNWTTVLSTYAVVTCDGVASPVTNL